MIDTPHTTARHTSHQQACPLWLRLMAGIAFLLVGLAFLAHGLLIIGNYFTYSDWRLPPKLIGKVVFFVAIGTTFAVSWLSLTAGSAWITGNGKVMRKTATSIISVVAYLGLCCFFALR